MVMVMVNAVSTTTRSLSLTCLDVTDNGGETPLDSAVRYGRTEVADYLKSVVSTPEPGIVSLEIPYLISTNISIASSNLAHQ